MKHRFTKYLAIPIGLLAIPFVVYLFLNLSIVTLVNGTGKQVSNITVQIAHDIWWEGGLSPKGSKTLFRFVDGDGGSEIVFEVEGRQHKAANCDYYVEFHPVFQKITLTEEAALLEDYQRLTIVGMSGNVRDRRCRLDTTREDAQRGTYIP